MTSHRSRLIIANLVLSLAYLATGKLGFMAPAFGSNITLIWLPAGIALAAVHRWGFGCWPGIVLGGIAVNWSIGTPFAVSSAIAVGNTIGAFFSAWVLNHYALHPAFDRKRDILILAAAGAAGTLLTSIFGVSALWLGGALEGGCVTALLTWWAGDFVGVIAATPLILAWRWREIRIISDRAVEFLLAAGATLITTWLVFVLNDSTDGHPLALGVLPLPLLAWCALRFGPVGISVAIIIVTLGAAYGTSIGKGPFSQPRPIENVAVLWVFVLTTIALGWLIAALHALRLRAKSIQQVFEAALDDISFGVLLAGPDRRITFANLGFTTLTGYGEEDLLGKSCAMLQGPRTDPDTIARIKSAFDGEGYYEGDILNYRKDGTTFWNALLISPVHDDSGGTTGYLGIQRDVTSRRHMEDALRQSEEHLRTIIKLEPECVKLTSPDGRLLEINPAGLRMLDADSIGDLQGKTLIELVAPEDRERYVSFYRRALAGEPMKDEFTMTSLLGKQRCMETHAVRYSDASGAVVGALSITRDVTKNKEAVVQMTQTLGTLQLFIDTVPALISFVDADERYQLVNRNYEAFYRIPKEQIVGKLVSEVQLPEIYKKIQPNLRTVLSGHTVRLQSNELGPGHEARWLDMQLVPRRDPSGKVVGFFVIAFDITDARNAEALLRDNEERLRLAMSAAHQGLYDLNVQTGECIVSPEYALMLGFDPSDFVESNSAWRERLHPDDQENVYRIYAEYVAGKRDEYRVEFRQRTKGGSWKWVLSLGSIVAYQPDGQPLRMLGTHTDITSRKTAEAALRESEDRLRMLTDAAFEGIAINSNGILLDCNEQLARILGRPRDEILHTNVRDYIAPEHRDFVKNAQLTGRTDSYEHDVLRPDGTRVPVMVRSRFAQFQGEKVRLTAIQDITERVMAEKTVRAERDLLNSFINSLPGSAYVVDKEKRLLRWNRAFEEMTGRTPEELEHFVPEMVFAPENAPNIQDAMQRVFSEGSATMEADFIHTSGKRTPHLFTGVRANVNGGWCMVGVGMDITERKRAEESLHTLSNRLLQAEDAERRRIAQELHDSTAQDLVAVTMNLGMLQDTLSPGDRDTARVLEDSIALLENSVNEIRTLAYLLHPPRLDEFGLAGALEEYAAGFSSRTDTRVRVEVQENFGRLPHDTEIVLFRLVQESLANVMRHSGSDMATIRLHYREGEVVLEVEDFGRGMGDTGVRGVGIAGMRERLEHLGGRLEIESDSSGTVVRAWLPKREIPT